MDNNEPNNMPIEQKIIDYDTKMIKYLYSSDSDYDSPDTEETISTISMRNCDFCKFTTKSKYILASHLHMKHGFLPKTPKFDCGICKKTFKTNRNLQAHNKRIHHKAERKPFKCSFCDFTSRAKQITRNHIREHVEASYHPCTDKTVGFNCMYCHFILWTREKLSEHILSRHTDKVNESYLLCYVCVATITNLATYRNHTAFRHFDRTQPVDGVYQCNICHLAYPTDETIRSHMQEAHPGLISVYCGADNCMEIMADDQQLKTHWSKVHDKITFQCSECFKLFKNKEIVQKHWTKVHENSNKSQVK